MKGKENIWICMASYLKPKLLSIFVWWLSLVANLTDLESLKDKQLATPLRDSTLEKEVHGKCEQNPRSQKEALAFFLLAFSVLASTCILFLPLLQLSFALEQLLQAASMDWRPVSSSKTPPGLQQELAATETVTSWRVQLCAQVLGLSAVRQSLMDYPDPHVS